jgi:hypothetical protein
MNTSKVLAIGNPEQELNELHIGDLPPGSYILLSKDTNGNLFYNHFQKF